MTRKVGKRGLFKWLISALSLCAFAEEPEGDNSPAPQANFETLIAQARKEEKAKLYPQIEKLKGEKETLTNSLNTLLLENAALKEEVEKYKSKKVDEEKPEDSEVYKDLKQKYDTLTAEMENLKNNTPNEAEIRKQLEAEYEVKLYRTEQLEKNKDEILSMLAESVTGNTKEEIDAAIAAAKEKTISVKKDLGILDDKGEPIQKPTTPQRAPAVAPPVDNGSETFDAEYIRNLDPKSKEYSEFRKKMGLK